MLGTMRDPDMRRYCLFAGVLVDGSKRSARGPEGVQGQLSAAPRT